MRKIVWALVAAFLLSSVPVPVQAASATYVSCRKKPRKYKFKKFNGKYKAPKFKKGKKRHQ